MAPTSIQSDNLTAHLQEGAIYKDRSNNVIRLLSICGDYCIYVYVSLANLRSSIHGSVTGFSRKDVFGADFVFVAGSVKDWSGSQHKHDAVTNSSDIVPFPSRDSRTAQPHRGVDFPRICNRHTRSRRASHG